MVDINLVPREYRKKRERFAHIFSKTGGAVLALAILSLLLYGGLLFYESNFNKTIDNINQEIVNLDIKRDLKTEQTMIDLDRKLEVLKDMFEEHLYWSKLFNKIEDLTVSEAYFSDARFNLIGEELTFSFSGNALTYTTLARQMVSFQEEPEVDSVRVSEIFLSEEGGIAFDFEVVFLKSILLGLEEESK